ncbi:hypothetical protein PFISCL1PPCAC_9158, partial [Pristionchus fissidentatus]
NPDVIGDIDDGVVFAANCTTPEPPSSEAMSSCLGSYLNSLVTGEWVGDTCRIRCPAPPTDWRTAGRTTRLQQLAATDWTCPAETVLQFAADVDC